MKWKSTVIAAALILSLVGNIALLLYASIQSETLSLVPRLKQEVGILASLAPHGVSKSQVTRTLRANGYKPAEGGERFNAPTPNSTLRVGVTSFVFDQDDRLIRIYSLSDALNPVYKAADTPPH